MVASDAIFYQVLDDGQLYLATGGCGCCTDSMWISEPADKVAALELYAQARMAEAQVVRVLIEQLRKIANL